MGRVKQPEFMVNDEGQKLGQFKSGIKLAKTSGSKVYHYLLMTAKN